MKLVRWIQKLVDPIVKKIVKGKTGATNSQYKDVKEKGMSYIETGTTGDKALDDYVDNSIGSGKLAVDMVSEVGKTEDWIKDQIEGLTGAGANETNEKLGNQNFELEKEKFEYDKALQQEMFNREDTAYQRTVNDMRLAGMNPLNMQGTNGAGAAVATTAPQNRYQEQPINSLGVLETIFNSALTAKMNASNASLNKAQANLINQQAESQRIKNTFETDLLASQLAGLKYDNNNKWFERENNLRNMLFNQIMGWTNDMPDWLKQNSAKFGYQPFKFSYQNKKEDFTNALGNPDAFFYNALKNPFFVDKEELSTKLISDELLNGTLGVLGSLFKMLGK